MGKIRYTTRLAIIYSVIIFVFGILLAAFLLSDSKQKAAIAPAISLTGPKRLAVNTCQHVLNIPGFRNTTTVINTTPNGVVNTAVTYGINHFKPGAKNPTITEHVCWVKGYAGP